MLRIEDGKIAEHIVNGPIRRELDMNSGTNAMGPYNDANSVAGRFFS